MNAPVGSIEPHNPDPMGNPRLRWQLRGVPHPFLGIPFESLAQAQAFQRSLYECHRCGAIHREGSPAESACAKAHHS